MTDLADRKCIPCSGDVPPLEGEDLQKLHQELGGGWNLVDDHHLEKEYKLDDFRQALELTNKIGELAEEVGHHPEIYLTWGKVRVKIYTHKVGGLTDTDFVWAAKADRLAA